jgi:hypothetical protein
MKYNKNRVIMDYIRNKQMTTVDFSFNPEKEEKILLISGEPKNLDKCKGYENIDIKKWGDDFFQALYKKCNDPEIQVNINCSEDDYKYLEQCLIDCNKKENTSITITKVDEKYINEKLSSLTPLKSEQKENLPEKELEQDKNNSLEKTNIEEIETKSKKLLNNTNIQKIDLMIVHDKFTTDIAQQLNAIMSTIPECQSRILSEKDWENIKNQISSEEYVLFLGHVKDGLALQSIVNWQFEKLNMKYGWIGKKGLILVEKQTFNKEDIEELKNMFEKEKVSYMNAWIIRGITIASTVLISPIGFAATAVLASINKKNSDKIYKAEYGYMINLLCNIRKDDFDTFIGYETEIN